MDFIILRPNYFIIENRCFSPAAGVSTLIDPWSGILPLDPN